MGTSASPPPSRRPPSHHPPAHKNAEPVKARRSAGGRRRHRRLRRFCGAPLPPGGAGVGKKKRAACGPGPIIRPQKETPSLQRPGVLRVDDGTRTHDTRNHNPMLYQLNYIHHLWDCKGSVFPINYPNFFIPAVGPLFFAATDAIDSQPIMQSPPPQKQGEDFAQVVDLLVCTLQRKKGREKTITP